MIINMKKNRPEKYNIIEYNVNNIVSEQLRLNRQAKKFTQKKLASKIGISPQAVMKYESGENKLSVANLYIIAYALNIPIANLIPKAIYHKKRLIKND